MLVQKKRLVLFAILLFACILAAGCKKEAIEDPSAKEEARIPDPAPEPQEPEKIISNSYLEYNFYGIPFLYPSYWEIKEDDIRVTLRDSDEKFPYVTAIRQGNTGQQTREDILRDVDIFFVHNPEHIITKEPLYIEHREEWEVCMITTYLNEDESGVVYQTYAAILIEEDVEENDEDEEVAEPVKERYDIVVIYHADNRTESNIAAKVIESIGQI